MVNTGSLKKLPRYPVDKTKLSLLLTMIKEKTTLHSLGSVSKWGEQRKDVYETLLGCGLR